MHHHLAALIRFILHTIQTPKRCSGLKQGYGEIVSTALATSVFQQVCPNPCITT